MADNVGYTPGTGALVASDEVTYSSDTSLVQLMRPVLVSGSEGSKTVVDLPGDATNGLDVDVTRLPALATVSAFKCATYATAQTGTALWTPAAGKAVVITAIQIQSYGTTAGTCVVWYGASGDTTYTRGTDLPLFDGEFAPSNTNKPGVYVTFPSPVRGTADFVVRVTTTNAQSVTVNVIGYEI